MDNEELRAALVRAEDTLRRCVLWFAKLGAEYESGYVAMALADLTAVLRESGE